MLQLEKNHFWYLHPVTWQTVLDLWREAEATSPFWIEHYTSRGYTSWDQWRTATHAPLKGDTLEWSVYQILDPLESVPLFYGGPFIGWKKAHYNGASSLRFREIVQRPSLAGNEKIDGLLQHFPTNTTLTGLLVGQDIYIIEGMHRCCALALAAQQNKKIETDLKIMLAQFPDSTLPELGTPAK